MKRILIITFDSYKKELKKKLKNESLPLKDIMIQGSEIPKIVDYMGKYRPEVIILDGEFSEEKLKNLHWHIGNTIGMFDIPCSLFSIRRPVKLPGVLYIADMKNLQVEEK